MNDRRRRKIRERLRSDRCVLNELKKHATDGYIAAHAKIAAERFFLDRLQNPASVADQSGMESNLAAYHGALNALKSTFYAEAILEKNDLDHLHSEIASMFDKALVAFFAIVHERGGRA